MTNERPPCPEFDYENMPYLSREGIHSPGNNTYLTRGLFLELADEAMEAAAPWCMTEHEVFAHGKWYPSAWMTYIHATDEYDALRKLVGNVKQWEQLKSTKWFPKILAQWHGEWVYLQRSRLRAELEIISRSGQGGATTAIRTLLQQLESKGAGKAVGRPTKPKPEAPEADHTGDYARVTSILDRLPLKA